MHHFFTDKSNIDNEIINITGTDVNHIKNVLRMKIGEELIISDGTGNDYLCSIKELQEDRIILDIIGEDPLRSELDVDFYLFQGLPKSEKMELIIQKTVELGVHEIIPVNMKRCIVKLDDKKKGSKLARWQAVAESAAKQSKRGIIPKVADLMDYKQALKYASDMDMILVPYENHKGIEETRAIVGKIQSGMKVGIFIGPEGGFDEKEIEYAIESGAFPITLGRRILRTETAGMTTLAILMFTVEK